MISFTRRVISKPGGSHAGGGRCGRVGRGRGFIQAQIDGDGLGKKILAQGLDLVQVFFAYPLQHEAIRGEQVQHQGGGL